MSAGRTFSPAAVAGMIGAGIVAFAALLLLIAFGDRIGSGRDGRPHALSVSAIGFKAVATLAGQLGEASLVRDSALLDTEDLVVVTLEAETSPDEVAQLRDYRQTQATMIVLPKWFTMPDQRRRGWVRAAGPLPGGRVERLLGEGYEIARSESDERAPATGTGLLEGLEVAAPPTAQTISGPGLEPLLTAADGGVLVARMDGVQHYLVADPDLLNNHGMRDPGTAAAALAMLDMLNSTGAEAVHFDLTLNGFSAGSNLNLLRLAFEPPFLAMTLALLAAAILAGLYGAARFGPVQPEERAIAFGKAALVENSAGLIRRAGRETSLAAGYADLVREQAAQAGAAPRELGGSALDAYLDRFSRPGAPTFSQLRGRLHLIRDKEDLVAAARALFRWKEDMIR